jgi:D-alanine--poly(phosphoribitol) ligase subunit 1
MLPDGSVSYGELCDKVRRFATGLDVRASPRVLIALPQGTDAYVSMLATGLAGGYYIPLNMSAPMDKIRLIVGIAEPDIVIVDQPSPALLGILSSEAPNAAVLHVAALQQETPLRGRGGRHQFAYLIFTSGSTGQPKGVLISRDGLNNYVQWARDSLSLTPGDRISQYANVGFDLSVLEIYGALCAGAALCPFIGAGDRLMPARLIAKLKITVWISVPSVINLMLRARQVSAKWLRSVRLFVFCGEPLFREHLDAIFAGCPGAHVMNTYGPTEATVSVTSLSLRAPTYAEACIDSVALGQSIPGTGVHLLGGMNAHEGEIVITGRQLAIGYWRDPARTAQMFRWFDLNGTPAFGYYTGDWAERHNNHLFFKRRIDSQVKVLGYRIELDEVESAIRACGWPYVCVFRRGQSLAAVVEAQDGIIFAPLQLRTELARKLEAHAIPADIRVINHIPRNSNDKLDREAVAAVFDTLPDPLLEDDGRTPV